MKRLLIQCLALNEIMRWNWYDVKKFVNQQSRKKPEDYVEWVGNCQKKIIIF